MKRIARFSRSRKLYPNNGNDEGCSITKKKFDQIWSCATHVVALMNILVTTFGETSWILGVNGEIIQLFFLCPIYPKFWASEFSPKIYPEFLLQFSPSCKTGIGLLDILNDSSSWNRLKIGFKTKGNSCLKYHWKIAQASIIIIYNPRVTYNAAQLHQAT